MIAQKSILFVCTANVFRSLSAELALKKYLLENGVVDWCVDSAGTIAIPEPIDQKTLETLREIGIDATGHQQKKLSREMLERYDIVVGMDENHIEFMQSKFNYGRAILFNELVSGKKTSITDVNEVPDYKNDRPGVEKKIERTVKEIFVKIPALFERVSK